MTTDYILKVLEEVDIEQANKILIWHGNEIKKIQDANFKALIGGFSTGVLVALIILKVALVRGL